MIKVWCIAYKLFEKCIWIKASSLTHLIHKFSMRLITLLLFLLWWCFHIEWRPLWSCWGGAFDSNPISPLSGFTSASASTSLSWCMGAHSILTSVWELCVSHSTDHELNVKVRLNNKSQNLESRFQNCSDFSECSKLLLAALQIL